MTPGKTILGIVAEYDPFHNGHALHLSKARSAISPDSIYVVLSPCLKQRGELSLFSPHMRACWAVRGGADAVFSLPVLWTIRDAVHYAEGAVSLLSSLGITHLAFGAETADLRVLQLCADFLEDPPSAFPQTLHTFLNDGSGYPASLARSVSLFLPEAGQALSHPNNTLGICYLRAIKKLKLHIIPVVIPRHGTYHDAAVDPSSPSAFSLREAMKRGDYSAAFQAMPPFSFSSARYPFLNRTIPDRAIWDALLLNALRTQDLSQLPDLSEGLQGALLKAAASSDSSGALLDRLVSKRYTASRISRLCAMAVLGATESRIQNLSRPSATLLLALRKKNVPPGGWNSLPVRVFSSAVEWQKSADPEDLLCWRIWAACCHIPDTLPFSERIYAE